MKKNLLLIFFLFTGLVVIASTPDIDSLLSLLEKTNEDTNKVNILLNLSEVSIHSQPDQAIYYAHEAKSLSTSLNYFKGIGEAYYLLAVIHDKHNNFVQSLENHNKAAGILEKLPMSLILGKVYNSIGEIYYRQANYELSLDHYLKGLAVYEKLKYEIGVALTYNNIGTIYHSQGNLDKATQYYHKSLEINEKNSDSKGIADSYNSIGEIYLEQGKSDIALRYFLRSSAIKEENNVNASSLATSYSNIGQAYLLQGKFDQTFENLSKSIELRSTLNDNYGLAKDYNNLGNYYFSTKNYEKSMSNFMDARSLAEQINAPEIRKEALNGLSKTLEKKGLFKEAYEQFVLFKSINDSLLHNESLKRITQLEMQSKFEKKQKQMILSQKEKEIEHKSNMQKQKTISYIILIVAVFFILLAMLIYRNYRSNKKFSTALAKQKREILEKNTELVRKNDKIKTQSNELEMANIKLEKQRDEVTLKNSEITDSIHYARRIQSAVLQETVEIESFFREIFILFRPRDIVSGDFYWIKNLGDGSAANGHEKTIVTVADCTGHGVPGAFMSMLGVALLNEIVGSGITAPNMILDQLRENIIKSLHQSGNMNPDNLEKSMVKDGMDIALCLIDRSARKLHYAGANNSLFVINEKGELEETKADKMPVSIYDEMVGFKCHELEISEGNCYYLFTDGILDQFGGPQGKKFKNRQFRELLVTYNGQSMNDQKRNIEKTLDNWMAYTNHYTGKAYNQLDDICVMGFRV